MVDALVTFVEHDSLAVITLDRPDSSNAVNPAFIADLGEAVARAAHPDISAVLLRANGAHFCVGADLKHFAARLGHLPEDLAAMANGFHAALAALYALPVPIVAAVDGAAVGAGFGLALAADMLIVSETARFSTGYAKLGLSADAGVSYFLTRALGERRARSLLMSARFVPGAEAHALGMADHCVARDALFETAMNQARALADGPTQAYAAIKRLTAAAASTLGLQTHLDRERDEIVALARHPRVRAAIEASLRR
ncbi:MAG: hypothetical protein JWR80_3000 [Bradyrhizobium sp.]|nr:hypothetical protein [Bradyrhizobium sp.]